MAGTPFVPLANVERESVHVRRVDERGRRDLEPAIAPRTDATLELTKELHQTGQVSLIGTSVEVINHVSEHPVYMHAVNALNQLTEQGQVSTISFMAAPHRMSDTIANTIALPQVYNPDSAGKVHMYVPQHWRPDLDRAAKDAEAEFLVFLMGVSSRLLKAAMNRQR